MGAPPGMRAPGMEAPGMGQFSRHDETSQYATRSSDAYIGSPTNFPPGSNPAPGMYNAQTPQQARFPPNFQPPANMPNIDFSAPVIRMGTTGPGTSDQQQGGGRGHKDSNAEPLGNRRGMGLGYDNRGDQRNQMRDQMPPLVPPTREEVARTIFVGNLTEGIGGEEGIQRILNCAGGLRRWTRVLDADNKPCTFGFAEYEDADSLATAAKVLEDVHVPTKRPMPNGDTKEAEEMQKTKLLVRVSIQQC